MKVNPKVTRPILVVIIGFVAAGGMIAARPRVETEAVEHAPPLVRIHIAERKDVQLTIDAQGSVVPRTESDLIAEVSGRIIWVSPSLASGGFLEPDDTLVRIDPSDYEVAVIRAQSALTKAESELELARAHLGRSNELTQHGVESSASAEQAISKERVADAMLRDAQAILDQARRDLERTHVRAPFAGRVRSKHVDVGQFVGRGAPVARIYAVDYAEVRLPIPDSDAAYVDLPIAYRDGEDTNDGPEVRLRAVFAGRNYTWHGRIVRTEGELDPRTRMIHAVVRVEDPYGRGDDPDRPPLSVGLFVQAEILGKIAKDVMVIPRSAQRGEGQVAVIDHEGRIRLREVDVLKRNRNTIVVRSGLSPGDQVCTSPLSITVEGMRVRAALDAPQQSGDGDDAPSEPTSTPGHRALQSGPSEGYRVLS